MYRKEIPGFWSRAGVHANHAKGQWIRRFHCRYCRRTFSSQTFRVDYWDKKPLLNETVFDRLSQSGGLRETARRLHGKLSRRGLVFKSRKIQFQLGYLHGNGLGRFRPDAEFSLDELVTHEADRVARPLTLPILIETHSMLVVAASSAPIAPFKRNDPTRRDRIATAEEQEGPRPHEDAEAVRRVLRVLEPHVSKHELVVFRTDKKPLYAGLLREVFGARRVRHLVYDGKPSKRPGSPLFRINLTAATVRDLEPRLRRRSWLAAKRARWLNASLMSVVVYRNYVRRRFNRDPWEHTPAVLAGLLQGPLTLAECVRWRQDFGDVSALPTSLDGQESWAAMRAG
jgi:hypothetical protein